MRLIILSLLFAVMVPAVSMAQEWPSSGRDTPPPMPKALEVLQETGAQIRYLGAYNDFYGWLVFHKGQPSFTYTNADGTALLQGFLFSETGENITLKQLQTFRLSGDADSFDALDKVSEAVKNYQREIEAAEETQQGEVEQQAQSTGAAADQVPAPEVEQSETKSISGPRSAGDQLLLDIENTNWVGFGDREAPEIYALIDPQCPHCRNTMLALKPYLDQGQMEIRMVPIGFTPVAKNIGALILASADPEALYYGYISGAADDLGENIEVNTQGVERNLTAVNLWDINVTPMIFYRDKNGNPKVIRGMPSNPDLIVQDISG